MNPKNPPPFQMESRLSGFDSLVVSELNSTLRRQRGQFVSLDNEFRYRHGIKWHSQLPGALEEDEPAEMQAHTIDLSISFDELIQNDLSALQRYINRFADVMMDEFLKGMYEKINDASRKTGNVVKGKGVGFQADQFLEMLEKIEFGVDRDGNVTLPQIHAAPNVVDEMRRVLTSQGPDFDRQVERIKREKIEAALKQEESRKARFP